MIRVGIGGWTYEPWRKVFYPPGLPQKRELEYAASRVTAIEVNGTYYRLQNAKSFAAWAEATPPGFVFTLKSSRFCTNRKVLGEAGESVTRFFTQGMEALGEKLGPILWQFAGTKQFDREEFAAFLDLLPKSVGSLPLRHAVEVRHESFRDPRFVDLARDHGAAIVFADSASYPCIADVTADFVYARLQQAREEEPEGYPPAELDRWAGIARDWNAGQSPEDLPCAGPPGAAVQPRDVFVFMINGAKLRAPAAAEALIARLGGEPPQ